IIIPHSTVTIPFAQSKDTRWNIHEKNNNSRKKNTTTTNPSNQNQNNNITQIQSTSIITTTSPKKIIPSSPNTSTSTIYRQDSTTSPGSSSSSHRSIIDYRRNPSKTAITANYRSSDDTSFLTSKTKTFKTSPSSSSDRIFGTQFPKTINIDPLISPVSPSSSATLTTAIENNFKQATLLNSGSQLLTASETFQNLKNLVKIDTKPTNTNNNNGNNTHNNNKQYLNFNRQLQQSSSVNSIGGNTKQNNGNSSIVGSGSSNSANFSTNYNKNFAKIRQHDSDALSPRPRRPYQNDSSSRYYNKNSDVNGQGRSIIGEQTTRSVTSAGGGNGGEGGGGGGTATRRSYQSNNYQQQSESSSYSSSSYNNNRNSNDYNNRSGGDNNSNSYNGGLGGGRSSQRSNSPYGGNSSSGGYRQSNRYDNNSSSGGRHYGGGGGSSSNNASTNGNDSSTKDGGYQSNSYNSNYSNSNSYSSSSGGGGNVSGSSGNRNNNYRNDRNSDYSGRSSNNDFDDSRSLNSRYNNNSNYNRNYNNYNNSGYNNNSNSNSLDRRYYNKQQGGGGGEDQQQQQQQQQQRGGSYNSRPSNNSSSSTTAAAGGGGESSYLVDSSSSSSSSTTTPVSASSYNRGNNNYNKNASGSGNLTTGGGGGSSPTASIAGAGNSSSSRAISPATPAPPSSGRWVPPSLRPQHLLSQNEKNDAVFRRVRGILNKLTPEKFQELSDDLLKLDLNSANILNGVILLIFDKALDEPKYSSMYAQLCKRLSKEAPNFEENSSDPCTFLRLLLAICRDSFNNRLKPTELISDNNASDNATGSASNTNSSSNNETTEKHQLTQEEEEKRHLAKQRMLGNVKFIGELNKLEMLSKKILHQCIQHLLDKKKKRTTTQQEMCEDMECLSQLLRTCGKNLDNTEQGKDMMNLYFERLERRSISTEYPPRIRFMLKDVIELRANNWVPRKVATTEGPVPIKQIRTDDDTPIRTPYANRNRDMRNNDRDNDNWMNRFPLNLQPGFNDMFGSLSVSGSSPIMSPGYNNNRQYNNQRNNQNNHHNNYNNRYNKHNNGQHNNNGGQHNNNMHNNQSSQYNQMLNNKELAPRFKSKLMSANQDAVENLQMRPAANSLLFKVAVQNTKQPPMLPMSSLPPQSGGGNGQQTGNSSASSSTSQLSANHYPLLATPASLNQNRPSSTPSSEYQYSAESDSAKPAPTITEKVLKSIASSPNFSTAANSGSNDDISAQSSSQSNKKSNTDGAEGNSNKQGPSDKNSGPAPSSGATKQAKKDKAFNKDEVLKRTSGFFKENFYTNDKEMSDLIEEFVQLKVPEKCMKDVCINLIMDVLDKSDQYFDRLIEFLQSLRKQSLIKANVVLEVFKQVVNRMNEREVIIPRIATLVACLLSKAVASANLLKLTEVAAFTENGQHYPLFLLVLQQLHKSLGRDTLEEMFRESKIDLMKSLPETDRNKTRLAEILDDRSLAFLYPLLKVQAEMLKQLQTDANPQAFYKWIKTTVDAKYYKDPGFITALMTVILKYITEETKLASSTDTKRNPEKSMIEKEETLLHKYCQILETFLNGNIDLQLIALYALQMFCYNANFPKGMLCRWFKNLYEASVIEEEAFLLWKEEISDKYPGKGTALFQVNNWLTWLEEAESEDEED
ncbi:eukaryotic translation initiation factor 4 gamma 2, partial [Episyrphus balteatus]|uniref:eukaryotic translation initiation factor 4 gamma 2 n=1 Tax=Episyrphus balteatus TaxID=286459 RepID=UPI002485EC91